MSSEWTIATLGNSDKITHTDSNLLSARLFTEYTGEIDWCTRMRRDPSYKDEYTRTAISPAGALGAQLFLIDRTIRIESSSLRMGGIGGVGTEPANRGQGLASRLMQDAISYMEKEKFDVSVLFSIPADFYDRFGYITVLPEYTTTIAGLTKLNSLRKLPTHLKTRKLAKKDLQHLAALYEKTYNEVTGSCIRDRYHWNWLSDHPDFNGIVVIDHEQIVGYALIRQETERLIVHEAGVEPSPPVHDALLRALARRTLAAGITELRLDLPGDFPFSRLCTLEHEAIQNVQVPRNRGGMAKVINLISVMKKLESVFSERVRQSQYGDIDRMIVIDTDIGSVLLHLHDGQVEAHPLDEDHPEPPDVAIPQTALTGLIFGLFYPAHILEVSGRPIPTDVLSLLNVLFPKRFPQIAWIDHF
ncbi:MAG: GNAT family N-acetyltransferase [Gemmatimonadota bacterium]|nr:GNAT family N-acetyltransferase [Gemmatimonadota bacterium]